MRIDLPVPLSVPTPPPTLLNTFPFALIFHGKTNAPTTHLNPTPNPSPKDRNSHPFATTTPGTNYPLVSARILSGIFLDDSSERFFATESRRTKPATQVGNRPSTVSRVLFRTRELTESCAKLREFCGVLSIQEKSATNPCCQKPTLTLCA